MAGDEGKRGRDERDPFEDLDQFFAPIEDDESEEELPSVPAQEPEGTAAEAEVSEEEAADALEDLEVEIELPDESDLLEGLPEEEEAEPETVEAADEAVAATGEEAVPSIETPEAEGEEWDRIRAETLAAAGDEGTAEEPAVVEGEPEEPSIPEVGPDLEGYPGIIDEDIGDLEGVEVEGEEEAAAAAEFADVGAAAAAEEEPVSEAEAAAEHFATGMRESADELERELLSDLEEGAGSEKVRIEPTEPTEPVAEGPTWQEGAQPVVTEEPPPAAPPPRNIPAALVSGILLGAGVLALLAINKGAFVVLATAAVILAQAELYAVMRTRGLQPATLLGLVCGGFTFVGAYLHGETAALLGPALAMGLTVPWYIAAPPAGRRHATANTAATVLGVVYVPFLASFIMLLLRTPDDAGRNLFLAVLVLTVLYDVVAYAVGSVWGNRPLAPTVSPQKSWEGAIAATFVILLVALAVVPNFTPFNGDGGPGVAVGLALVIAVVAPLGDLVESAFKRDLGVKDMGSLLPGHGGMLDRIDAVLFAAPAAYFFLRIALG
jgi:phosphatidate cytidylyltransferase